MTNLFPLLAIETSDELCSVAVLLDEKKYAEQNIRQKHVHSEKLVTMIELTLASISLKINDLKTVAVSQGPGSFTGLRIGMAAAKGIASGTGLSLIPVPTFSALASKISDYINTYQKFVLVKSVNREEVYFAKYLKEHEILKEIEKLSLLKKSEVDLKVKQEELVYGYNYTENNDLTTPTAVDIGRWAYKFGKDLLTSDYDLIEPLYLKKFVAKEKK